MKLFIILLLSLQVFAYSAVNKPHRTHKAFIKHHPRMHYRGHGIYYHYQEPSIYISQPQGQSHSDKVKEANKEAREHNKEINAAYEKQLAERGITHPTQAQVETIEYKEIDFTQYEDSAQLILENVHLYGVSEVKIFKKDKVLVQAVNGKFAFPIKTYESAKKIHFQKVKNNSLKK